MSRGDFWLSSNLRVKMVDRQYRKRYYNTKVRAGKGSSDGGLPIISL